MSTRQLAAIMFTDIEGYTALMQGDEGQAIKLREGHRIIFKNTTEKYQGKILQYYGDGTLSIFNSAIDAVHCAIEMQLAFQKEKIPVRIGIHTGDIIYSKEDIIGDGVNVASRIESLAVAGSVFISEKVYDEIKNQPSLQVKSMGTFELKNVLNPVEILCLSNQGLVVPNPSDLQGKTKQDSSAVPSDLEVPKPKSFWENRWLLMIIVYIGGSRILVALAEWLLDQYQISPHWNNILLVFLISMFPSLILYTWKRKGINKSQLTQIEKFAIPGNLVVAILLVVFLFKGMDLGATSQVVVTVNENGQVHERSIIKPEFRKSVAIFFFVSEEEDSANQWLRSGICAALAQDLRQSGYLRVGDWSQVSLLQERITQAKNEFYDFVLSGSYQVENNNYVITTELHQTQNGQLRKKHTYTGTDFLTLIDTISLDAKRDLGLTSEQSNQFVDLPFSEGFTSNLEAYKHYSLYFAGRGIYHLEQAVAIDSTFAFAHYINASNRFGWSTGLLGAKAAISRGMRHRKRLPEDLEAELRTLHFQINQQPNKAIALLKMQLDLDPGNQEILETLNSYLYMSGQYDELLSWRKKLVALDPDDPDLTLEVAEAMLLNNQFKEAGQIINEVLEKYPNNPDALGSQTLFYALSGKMEQADSLLQMLVLMDPEMEPLAKEYSKSFHYYKNHPVSPGSSEKYVGSYRVQNRPADFDVRTINNLLFIKGRTQRKGFFQLPCGPNEFILGDGSFMEKWKYISDTTGNVYKIIIDVTRRNQQKFKAVLWRQDSLILKARGLLKLDQKAESLGAFRIAYRHHPQHFYLANYIQHLEFMLDASNQQTLENMKRFVGQYGPRRIWLENGLLYYQRESQVTKTRILPFSADRFYFIDSYENFLQVVLENGEIKGTVSWDYNPGTENFEVNDDDYIALDVEQE